MEDNLVYSFNGVNDEIIKVFLPKFEIDMDTMKQIKQMTNDKGGMILKNVRIMPDCHRGHGCCVGLTAQIEDKIYPRYVGVDIGCGISMYPLNIKLKPKKIPKVEQLIRAVIPMGFDKHKKSQMRDSDWELLIERSNNDLVNLREKFSEGQLPEKIDREWMDEQEIKSNQVGCCMFKIINGYLGLMLIDVVTGACCMRKSCKGKFYHVIGSGNGKIMKKVSEYLRDNKIKPVIDKVFTIDDAESAFNYLKCSKALGKIVINFR
jgi:hypothetical protein